MYLTGFGNHHQTEAIAGALPTFQNSPQQCPLGLFAEQISGSAFTRPRQSNLHTWTYRRLPSVVHKDYKAYAGSMNTPFATSQSPNPMRWSLFSDPTTSVEFQDSLFHIAGNSHLNAYLFQCNQTMTTHYFSSRDGELLFVPFKGRMRLQTEFGFLEISPGMIAVIPRGIFFKVELQDAYAAGYLCENSGMPLTLPQLGLIGANGLANPRHFFYPRAAVEEEMNEPVKLICKYQHHLFISESHHTPFNVVAWHGNYAPYAYDLSLFNTLNTVSFDHPDPSIFTVLTSESEVAGVANFDFVIFPPRWMVAEHTFRPPYFHRNIMSELMGLIKGEYDAKCSEFEVGGFSIHNSMTPHGPDTQSYHQATIQHLKPKYYDNTLAFMFETQQPWHVTEAAFIHPSRQPNYSACWQNIGLT